MPRTPSKNIFLQALFIKEFKSKFNYQGSLNLDLHMHLRLANDQEKDFIHTDFPKKYSSIVYLLIPLIIEFILEFNSYNGFHFNW